MPLKPFQENFWNLSDTVAPPPLGGGGGGGYPLWQSYIVASLFGALWELGHRYLLQWRWWLRVVQRLRGLSGGLRDGVWDALDDLERGPAPPAPAPEPRIVERLVPVPVVRHKPKPRVRSLVQFARRVRRLSSEEHAVLLHTMDLLESPQFALAQQAVRTTATTPKFNRPESWGQYSKAIKTDPGRAENVFRHIRAHELTRQAARELGSTLSNPQAHLLVELAYHEFAIKGR
jgi:hypothetical protein